MKYLFSSIVLAATFFFGANSLGAQERLFVDITDGVVAPLTVGVPDMVSGVQLDSPSATDAGPVLAEIVRADLATDPFFRVIATHAPMSNDEPTVLREYARRGTQALIMTRITRTPDEMLNYYCAFIDVFSGVAELEREFRVAPDQWRRAAHKCADMVVAHATGYKGHFDTRFALVASPASQQLSAGQIIAIDVDGANGSDLIEVGTLVAMPRFSPDNRYLIFIEYQGEIPGLVLADLRSSKRTRLKLPSGLPSAARFSPDGQKVAFALSQSGNTDIYEYDLTSGRVSRLTDTAGIDTSPSYSPDGSQIVFESDRSGQPQLYVMQSDGKGQQRISFGGSHGSPSWSPDGRFIAFVTHTNEGSGIGLIAPDGTKRRILSKGPHDEDPVWAPSSRAIAFQHNRTDLGPTELRIVDFEGRRQSVVPLVSQGTEPDWSEVLP